MPAQHLGVGIAQVVDEARGEVQQGDGGQLLQGDEHLLDLPGVWLTTPGEIANHYTALHPPPGATAE